MKKENQDKLFKAWAYCDMEDKSTEFMLNYMADIIPGWDESDVVDWMSKNSHKRDAWYKANPNWYK